MHFITRVKAGKVLMNYIFCFKVLKQMHVLQCINKTHQSNLLLYRMNLTCKGRHIQTMLKLESRLKKLSTYITFSQVHLEVLILDVSLLDYLTAN